MTKGGGGVKNLEKLMTSFMNGPKPTILWCSILGKDLCTFLSICKNSQNVCANYPKTYTIMVQHFGNRSVSTFLSIWKNSQKVCENSLIWVGCVKIFLLFYCIDPSPAFGRRRVIICKMWQRNIPLLKDRRAVLKNEPLGYPKKISPKTYIFSNFH